jgi:hypothetical protein
MSKRPRTAKRRTWENYCPLPWSLLTYNPQLKVVRGNIGEEQLKGAPKYTAHETWDCPSTCLIFSDVKA